MHSDVVEPVYVVRQLQTQLLKGAEPPARNELLLDQPECRFSHRVVIGTALHAQGALDLKAFQDFIHQYIVKLAAAVCMKDLDLEQASLYGCKGFVSQSGVFMCTGTVSDDLPGSQIQQHAYVGSLGSYTNIDTGSREPVDELPVNQVGHWGFVHPGRMNPILLARVGEYQSPPLHDPPDLPPRYDPALPQQHMLELTLAVYTPILIISVLEQALPKPTCRSASAFVAIGAACNA